MNVSLKSHTPAALLVALITALAALALAGTARADFGIAPGTLSVKTHGADPAGPSVTQAGAHSDLTVAFGLRTATGPYGLLPDGSIKDVSVVLPPGFTGDATATPTCTARDFAGNRCSRTAMVGVDTMTMYAIPGFSFPAAEPVYNLVAPDGVVARLGFQVATVSVVLDISVRSDGSYSLATDLGNLSEPLPIAANTLTLWGVPADHNGAGSLSFYAGLGTYGGPGGGARIPFLTTPTSCTGDLTASIKVDSWQNAGTWDTESATIAGMTGCERLPFESSVDVRTTTSAADAPTGLDVGVNIKQYDNPDGLSAPALRRAVVDLPEGLTISPSAGAGLAGCSDDQFGLKAAGAAACPAASRVGTVRIDTPLLPEPLTGTVFQATQAGSDPESGDMYRLFVEAEGSSVRVKLLGKVMANRDTGRLTAVFDDTPPLQFSRFQLSLNGGPRAELATPRDCGTKTTSAALTPWSSDAAQTSTSDVTIDCGAAVPFAPGLRAGAVDPSGGAFAPFALKIDRPDGMPDVNNVVVKLPPGLLARIKGVTLCGDADASAGTCPEGSRVGTATVASGAGSNPLSLTGTVSLTGAYKGAPYGLAVAVRAVAGPFDLGMVVVRQAVFVDKDDAHLTVFSDPLPTILKGVPLRLRSIALNIDRPGFMVNPTSCAKKGITTTLGSPGNVWHQVQTAFQGSDCQALPLAPKLKLSLNGSREHTVGKHPGLHATITQAAGEANMKSVQVTLPLSLALDPDNANSLCSYDGGRSGSCPAASQVGTASAVSPLLNQPLSGPVYLVQGMRMTRTGLRKTLPTLFVPLRGEIAIDLRATTAVHKDKLVTTFGSIPDAAISQFDLQLTTGRGGILATNTDVCRGRQVADYAIDGQNGKQADGAATISPPCSTKAVKKKAAIKARR
jgi:hypothetical protein